LEKDDSFLHKFQKNQNNFIAKEIITMKKNKEMTYQEALQELLSIQERLANNEILIDELQTMVQRATVLLTFCKEKLRSTEESIENQSKL
jgi:exodeoxyribonuclease VII small subunit